MLLTAEEAKTKICPQYGINNCVASDCAAWRWVLKLHHGTGMEFDMEGRPTWQHSGKTVTEPPATARGFCGLAGRP